MKPNLYNGEYIPTNLMGVYCIVNLINNKIYIGSSKSIRIRWNEHIAKLRKNQHENNYLQRAWNKYGENSFDFRILEVVNNKEELVKREQYYLDLYKSYDREKGYNISPTAQNCLGVKRSEEAKRRQAEKIRGRKHKPESIVKMSLAQRQRYKIRGSKPLSEEHKQKLSLKLKGQKRNDDFKRYLSEIRKGSLNPLSKLNEKQVYEIKLLLKFTDLTLKDIAKLYNVSFQLISNIKRPKTKYWNHISVDDVNELPEYLKHIADNIMSNKKQWKLPNEVVMYIKKMLERGFKQASISRYFDISDSTINSIARGVTFKHITIDSKEAKNISIRDVLIILRREKNGI